MCRERCRKCVDESGALGDATTQDNYFRVDGVDHRCQRARQPIGMSIEGTLREQAALSGGCDQLSGIGEW